MKTEDLIEAIADASKKVREVFDENECLKEKIYQMASLMDAQAQTIDSLEKEIAELREELALCRQRNKVLVERNREREGRDEHFFSTVL